MLRGKQVQLKRSFDQILYIYTGSKGSISSRSILYQQERAGTQGCLDERLFYLALLQNHNKYKVDKMEFTLIQKGSEVSCLSILQPDWKILYCQEPCYEKRKKYQAVQKIDIWFQLEGQTANQEQLISKRSEKLGSGQVEVLDGSFPLKRQNVIGIMVIDNSLNLKRSIKDKNASKPAQQLTNGLSVIFATSCILDFFLKSNSTSMFSNAQNSLVLLNRSPFEILPTIIYTPSPKKPHHSTTLLSPQNANQHKHLRPTLHNNIYALRPLKYRILKISPFTRSLNSFQGHNARQAQGRFKKRAAKTIESEQRGKKLKTESLYFCSLQENQAKLEDLLIDRYSFQNSDPNKGTLSLSQSTQIMLDDFLDDDLLTFKKSLKLLRKSQLFSYLQCWDSSLQEYLTRVLQNWDLYYKTVKKDLTLFLRMNQYKMLKAGCSLMTTWTSQLTTPFYDLIYPKLRGLLKRTMDMLELQSLQALKNRFINDHREDGSIIQRDKQFQGLFLQQVKNDLRMEPQKKVDMQLYHLLEQFHSFLFGHSQLTPSFLPQFEKAISSALLQNLSPNNLLGLYNIDSPPHQNLANNLIFRVKQQIQKTNTIIFKETEEKERVQLYLKELQNQKLSDANCLGCSKFFYRNMNVFDVNLCKVPLKAFSSIQTITEIENELKDSICAMLNCGGGIILFDCQLSQRELVAKGFFLTELKKESEERRIGSYLQSFYPPLQLNKNIQISFVPIVSSPLSSARNDGKKSYTGEEGTIKQYEWYYERSYVRGYYVTRIRVKPSNGTQVFYWYKSKKPSKDIKEQEIIDKYCCAFDGEKIKYLRIQEMAKLIKRKFRSYYVPSSYSPIEKMLMAKPFDVFGHECLKPESGMQVAESEIKQIKSEIVVLKDAVKKITHTSHQYRYPNMILLIVHKKHLQAIKDKLNSLRISCEIERRFESHNLRPAFNTAILYHDKAFDLLHKHLANDQQFNFANAKPMLLIQIKAYLKFERDMKNFPSKDDIQRYQSWLKKQFPNEKLKLLSYALDRKRKQFYLTTQSKLSALFMYFMMAHHGEKIVFRNPLCVDRPQTEERNKLEILYESPSG